MNRDNGLSSSTTGIALVVAASLSSAVMVAVVKELVSSIPSGTVAFARFAVQVAVLGVLLFIWPSNGSFTPRVSYLVRGALLATSSLLLFSALIYMPIVDATAIYFAEPLFMTVLGALFLNERIGTHRSVALCIGFIGAIIVVQPSFEQVGLPAVFPLVAALCTAICMAITRSKAGSEPTRPMQFWICVSGSIVLGISIAIGHDTPFGALAIVTPSVAEIIGLLLIGALGTAVQVLFIAGIQRDTVGILAPFGYLELVGIAIIGIAYFNEWPQGWTWLGLIIVTGAGLYSWHRERQLNKKMQGTTLCSVVRDRDG